MFGYLLLYIFFGAAGYVAGAILFGPGAGVYGCVVVAVLGMLAYHPGG